MLTCEKCIHKKSLTVANTNLGAPIQFCLRYPPTSHILVQTDKFGQQIGFTISYPNVTDQTTACGEYSENSKIYN